MSGYPESHRFDALVASGGRVPISMVCPMPIKPVLPRAFKLAARHSRLDRPWVRGFLEAVLYWRRGRDSYPSSGAQRPFFIGGDLPFRKLCHAMGNQELIYPCCASVAAIFPAPGWSAPNGKSDVQSRIAARPRSIETANSAGSAGPLTTRRGDAIPRRQVDREN